MTTEAKKGRLLLVSGPSGSGKTTVIDGLLKDPRFRLSISSTTRPMRPGEVEGEEYNFLSVEQFEEAIAAGGFLEWAKVYGNYYGTPRAPIEEAKARGEAVLLNLDTQGAATLRKNGVRGLYVFLLPPSLEVLEERLRARATDSEETILKRLARAEAEMDEARHYDAQVVNDDLDRAVGEIRALALADDD
ncbi:guanylate kinase [Planctomycetota bacterium]